MPGTRRATHLNWPRVARFTALPTVIAVVTALASATAAYATGTPSQQAASVVVKGLVDLGNGIGAASGQPALSAKLPLTDISVRDVLALETAVGQHVTDAVTGASADLDSLAGIVSADPALDMSSTSSPAGAPSGSRDWLFTVDLRSAVPIPLTYDDGRLQFGAAQLTGEAAGRLTATFRVRYDPNALVLRQFSVVGDTLLTTHVWTRATGGSATTGQQLTAPSFPAVDGFVQLDAAGTGTIDTTTVLRLRDPNGRGALTTEDFEFSSADEMFTTQTPPGNDDVHMNVNLGSTLLSSGSHGTVAVGTRDNASTSPYATPVITRDTALTALTALTRPQALAAFTRYASAMSGVEGSVDAELPLLSVKLTDLYSPATQLLTIMAEQAAATVTCGAADTSPPSGAPRPGQSRYCQAKTDGLDIDSGSTITWSSPDSGVTFTGSSAGTVGQSPTANVRVDGGGGFPTLRVSFVSGGRTYTARSLLVSIQQLAAAVQSLGLGGALSYDSATRAIEVQVRQNDTTSAQRTVSTGGNGGLAPLTGLTGLCQADTSVPRRCPQTGDAPTAASTPPQAGSATVTTTGRQIAADFGIGLVPPAPAPVEGATPPADPVAYVKPGTGGLLWEVATATAAMTANAPMSARIGFLQVDVDVTSYSLATNASSSAARVTVPTGNVTIDGGTVSGAVALDTLLAASPTTVPTRGLTATAHLAVQDAPMSDAAHTRPIGKSGTIDATWTDLRPDHLPSVTTGGDYADLRALDIVPARQGVMGAGTSASTHTMVDSTADFLAQFGLTSSSTDKTVTRQVYDLDALHNDQTVCTEFTVVDAHTITCTKGALSGVDPTVVGHPDEGFTEGHHYVINGDPTALRDVLIEDLASVLNVYATPDHALGADRTLPLVDLLPSDIDAARTDLGKALVGLRHDSTDDAPVTDVSSLQGFAGAVGHYAPGSTTTLSLDTTSHRLEFQSSKASSGTRVDAALRVSAGDRDLRVLSGVDAHGDPARVTVPLQTTSDADVHLAVDLTNAASFVGNGTSVGEQVTGFATPLADVKDSLENLDADYGATTVKTANNGHDIGIGVDVVTAPRSGSAAWIPIGDFRGTLSQVRSVHGSAQTCGDADLTADPSLIAACAEIPLVDHGNATLTTVVVALRADESSGGTGADLAHQPLAYQFLADGLAGFSKTLTDALDGNLTNLAMPFVGTDLDGGADIPAAVQGYVAAARARMLDATDADGDPIDEHTDADEFATALTTALNGVTVTGLTHNTTTVTVTCDGDPCADADTVADITEVRAPIHLTGHKTNEKSTFRPGPAGVAIDTDLEAPTDTTWDLDVVLGIQRGTGPFLVMVPASGSTVTPLTLHVTAHLPTYNAANCHPWAREGLWETKRDSSAAANTWVLPNNSSTAQCLDAFVGTLPSVLVDRKDLSPDGHDTGLDAHLSVSVTPGSVADSDGRVSLPKLFDKKLPFTTTATGSGALAVYFESYASTLGFFDVIGTIDLDWANGVFNADGEKFGHLVIDAETAYAAIGIGYQKAKKWLSPLNPVVDVLAAEIPGLSQLAKLVGAPPMTILSILAKGDPRIAVVTALLQFQQMVARLPGADGPELVNLGEGVGGAFKLPFALVQLNKCSKTVDMTKQGGLAFTAKSSGTGTAGRCDESGLSKLKRLRNGEKAPKDPTAGKQIQKQMTKSPQFSLPSVTFPVFEDANQIYDLLTGTGDATLLYIDLGHAGYKVQLDRNFGPLMIGPVPVVATVSLIVGLDARFAFGFDTHGLTKMVQSLDPGDVGGLTALSHAQVFADGFYIDDLEKGVDVPEIALSLTVQAGAAVSIGFAEAGIRGGVILDLQLDAFDPNGDGRIYTDEFAGASNGPDCAFNVSSGLTFFLQFWFHIDLFLTSIDKAFDIVRSPRIVLFEFNCTIQEPTLAVVEGGNLWLTMGDHVSSRHAFTSTTNEKYTVRQLAPTATDGTTLVQVSAFNLVQNYTVPSGGQIRANATTGTDTVKLLPGQVVTTATDGSTSITDVPFTVGATIDGGADNDVITTANGNDTVTGGTGNDVIDTGLGNDTVNAGDGNDSVDGGGGHDTITGGIGDDRLSGGAGTDSVVGGTGDDVLDGGIGALPTSLFTTIDTSTISGLLDAGDVVVGNDGSDHVAGGDGSDLVAGGAYDISGVTFTGTQTTTVFGLNATNTITRLVVTNDTVNLPTLAAVRAECAIAGTAVATDRDDVSGGNDRDYVLGGGGPDVLSGGAANDVVCGRGSDDSIDGDGADVTVANQGDDEMSGGPGNDQMYGAGGNDTMAGDLGDDLARAGNGNDTVNGGGGSDLLLGEAGTDVIVGDDTSTAAIALGTGRAITCRETTSVIGGGIDLNDDLSANALDDGRLEGLSVVGGEVRNDAGTAFTGMLGGVVFSAGNADLNGNGTINAYSASSRGDTGVIDLAGVNGAVGDGDCVLGGDGTDTLDGNRGGDYVDGGAGDDPVVGGGTGDDLVRGGAGNDIGHGDAGDDLVAGDAGDDLLYGDAGDDVLRGSSGDDLLAGGGPTASATDGRDQVLGDGGADVVAGGNALLSRVPLANTAIPGVGVTLLATTATSAASATQSGIPAGVDDQAYGGYGADWVFAGSGDDQAFGGPDDDVVEGGPGADTVQGDDGNDLLVGGSSTGGAVTTGRSGSGIADGGDTIVGDHGVDSLDGSDVLAGDNARLDPAGSRAGRWPRIRSAVGITLFDGSGADTMTGDGADDLLMGQGGKDTMSGNDGADALEGDGGADTIHGNAGNDEIVGGSWTAGAADGGDTITGDDGDDTIAGDNASIDGTVTLNDTGSTDATLSGGDTINGNAGADDVFAQGGDDTAHGDDGADVVEGGSGTDSLTGDAGDDLLTGGTSAGDGVIDTTRNADGIADGGDTISGNDGSDVVAGDNAYLRRQPATGGVTRGTWPRVRPFVGVVLFDVSNGSAAAVGGADTITGGTSDDLLLAQGGDDTVNGNDGADAIEGGSGADTLRGDAGNDEVVGGAGTAASYDGGDTVSGDAGNDVVVGDNGVIDSTATPAVTLLDVPAAGAVAIASYSGNDTVTGDAGDDTVFGGGGDDTLSGNDDRDALEGDAGADTLNGGAADDELTGGSSSTTGVISAARTATGQLDGADTLTGGAGDDVMAGDNARLIRTASTRSDGTVLRTVQLFDQVGSGTPVGGGDTLTGDTGRDLMFGQGGDDTVSGGDGVDYAEGNAGNDTIAGDGGQDDVVGGSSAANGAVLSGTGSGDRLLTPVTVLVDSSAAGVVDGNDVIHGGSAGAAAGEADSADVLLGDNGRVTRSCSLGTCTTIGGGGSGVHTVRQVAMADTAPGVTAGNDTINGEDGDDELYGQLGNDTLSGDAGDDALVGDQGVDVPTPAATLGKTDTTLTNNGGFLSELVRPAGTLVRVVTQTQPTVGGDDVLLGGTGFDSVHAGAGNDVVNAGDGDDVVFAGDGNDAVWGGVGHDRMFGGTGDDVMDRKTEAGDPVSWRTNAPVVDTDGLAATVNGLDTTYGGSGHDAAQADMGDTGKTIGDRLVDWTGSYNLYQVCLGAYGAGKIQNKADPSTVTFLQNLAAATGSVGGGELALVGNGAETNPQYAGWPGHFTCESG